MLSLPSDGPLSLYLHIPFCTTCCSYCAFYSEPQHEWVSFREAYIDRMVQEIQDVVSSVGSFETIFVGGGNPGCLQPMQLARLLREAQKNKKSSEVTIEMNPETFSEDFFMLFEEGLVTRLSMGIQSMDDSILARLGRNARVEDNLKAIALAKKARDQFSIDLSFDLMAALPGQNDEMAVQDLQTLLAFDCAQHISFYCLTVEEGTELARQVQSEELSVRDEDQQMEMLSILWNILSENGFSHYEVSNFAQADKTCKHNQIYWRLQNYIGLGSTAASTITLGSDSWHYMQTQSLQEYATSAPFSGYEKESLSENEQIEEYLLAKCRTSEGISKREFSSRFSLDFDALFSRTIAGFDQSWFVNNAQVFALTEYGFMVSDEIILRLSLQIPQPLDRL